MYFLLFAYISSFVLCNHSRKNPLVILKNILFQQQSFLIPNNILQSNLRIDKYIPKRIFGHLFILHLIDLPNFLKSSSNKGQIEYLHIECCEKDLIDSYEIGLGIRVQEIKVPSFGEELGTV